MPTIKGPITLGPDSTQEDRDKFKKVLPENSLIHQFISQGNIPKGEEGLEQVIKLREKEIKVKKEEKKLKKTKPKPTKKAKSKVSKKKKR